SSRPPSRGPPTRQRGLPSRTAPRHRRRAPADPGTGRWSPKPAFSWIGLRLPLPCGGAGPCAAHYQNSGGGPRRCGLHGLHGAHSIAGPKMDGPELPPSSTSTRRRCVMPAPCNILIMGASYGSLLASKLLFGGHKIMLVCLPAEADLINSEGF